MSDNSDNDETEFKPFTIEYAKTGRALCKYKKCKQNLETGQIRMSKVLSNPFGSGTINHWYHVDCLLENFTNQRASTKRLESINEIDGWNAVKDSDKNDIFNKFRDIKGFNSTIVACGGPVSKTLKKKDNLTKIDSKDNSFKMFHKICDKLAKESSYLGKTAILQNFFTKGSNGNEFDGNIGEWIKLLLPGETKQVYNLQNKQLMKIFSRLFKTDHQDMLHHLENGDVADTLRHFFEKSKTIQPTSTDQDLKLNDIIGFLEKLSILTREDEQIEHFRKFLPKCTSIDLQMIIRFVKHDLRINAGAKHILAALHSDAYSTYQLNRDLNTIIRQYEQDGFGGNKVLTVVQTSKKKSIIIKLMTPISPMLAAPCKSLEKVMDKYENGIYSEIKYDGERIQLHKRGNEFNFFSRNLKPVGDHKIKHLKEAIKLAFPNANDLVLDSEILVVNKETGDILPFGTLGKHKMDSDTSQACLFVFDCIYYNGDDLKNRPLRERREILLKNIKPIKYKIELSELHTLYKLKDLRLMVAKVLQEGLEGLVLKPINSIYEPGKRHWFKIKKDYLFDGQMADTADLVVLGGWYGTGRKGGILSIFLMGCYDKKYKVWKTVTKVHSGLDDKTMEKLHKELKLLMARADPDNPPIWLNCKKQLIPDMLAIDPMKMPVWEITGAEFSKSDTHTANGISIRFPRITKIRHDKSVDQATNMAELKALYDISKDSIDLKMLTGGDIDSQEIRDFNLNTNLISPQKQQHTGNTSNQFKMQVKQDIDDGEEESTDDSVDNKNNDEKKYLLKRKIKTETKVIDDDTTSVGSKPNVNKRRKLLDIFEKVVLFVCENVQKLVTEELKYFELWGGTITTDAKNCTHALHKSTVFKDNFKTLRKLYPSTCQHYCYTWLLHSVRDLKVKSGSKYLMKVKS